MHKLFKFMETQAIFQAKTQTKLFPIESDPRVRESEEQHVQRKAAAEAVRGDVLRERERQDEASGHHPPRQDRHRQEGRQGHGQERKGQRPSSRSFGGGVEAVLGLGGAGEGRGGLFEPSSFVLHLVSAK